MTPLEVAVARRLTRPAEVGVQVAVRLLRGDDPRRDPLESVVDLRVQSPPVLPGQGLQQLVDLGVGELPAAPRLRQAALDGGVEVAQPALALQPVLDVAQRDVVVALLEPAKEAAGDRHLAKPERAEGAPRRVGWSAGA